MPPEPSVKRAYAYFDGQNLFHAVKEAFGYSYPNYDPLLLARAICEQQGWTLQKVHFYTGMPDAQDKPFWNAFWSNKLGAMGKRGVRTIARRLKYRRQFIRLSEGNNVEARIGQEKGIDVRLALDIVRHARRGEYDVAVIFSQDQDLTEAAREVRHISIDTGRWIKIASAYPAYGQSGNSRGVNETDWLPFHKDTYDLCLDPNDYRPVVESMED